MTLPWTIRRGGPLDTPRIGPLLRACLEADEEIYPAETIPLLESFLGPAQIRYFLESSGHLLIAEVQGGVVGFAVGLPDSVRSRFGTYYAAWVAVHPLSRLRGIGLSLLESLQGYAAECGCHKLYGLVRTNNAAALEMFRRAGHTVEGTLRKHWFGLDYYFMAFDLSPRGPRS